MSQIRTLKVKGFKNNEFHIETYDSAYQVVEDCKKRKITNSSFDNMREERIRKSWHGVGSYDEALKLMETGYQPTVEKLKKGIKPNLSGVSKRVSFHNDVVGYAPIVPLAIMGVPQSMMNSYMRPVKAKVINVYYYMSVNAGCSSEELMKAGQKFLGAIMELELQGYRMNIYCVQSYYQNHDGADMMCVKIKSANQPLDLQRVSFPLTHPAFFRVIGFDWYSKFPIGKYRFGYGSALGAEYSTAEMQKGFEEIFGNNIVVFVASKIIENDETQEHLKEVIENVGSKKTAHA